MLMRRKDVIMLRPEYEALGFGVWENVFPRGPRARSDLDTRTRKARYVDGEVVLGRAVCVIYIHVLVLVFGVNQPTIREHSKFTVTRSVHLQTSRCHDVKAYSSALNRFLALHGHNTRLKHTTS